MFAAAASGVRIGRVVMWLELAPDGAARLRGIYKRGSGGRRVPPDDNIVVRQWTALRRGSEDFGAGNLTAAPLELQHLHADPCLQEPRVSEQLNRGASS